MNHSLFMPHGWCMTWNPWLIGLNVSTDALIALAYYSIPAALFYLGTRRKVELKVQPILILFGLFIALCGGGHAIDIVSVWKPIYWTKGFWNLATAAASVLTAIVLIPRTVEFLKLPETAERLEKEAGKLRQQYALLQTVIDSVEEGIILLDAAGTTTVRNPAAEALLKDNPKLLEWSRHKSTDQDTWRSSNGKHIERFTTAATGYGQLYVLRDLTSRMEAWQARIRLERIISTMKQGFALVSLDANPDSTDGDRIVQTNQSLDEMHGLSQGSLVGRSPESLFAGSLEDRRRSFREIREACQHIGFWDGETSHVCANGPDFVCSSRYNFYREEGQTFLSSIHYDITEQKRIHDEAARVQSRLLQSAKLESLGVLAGGVAHDFNNLLTGILGNTSLAIEFLPAGNPAISMLGNAINATERAAKLTHQLLAYSGKGRFLIEPVHLTSLSREISALVHLSIPRGVQLDIEVNPALPMVEADVTQIQQLIMNLVINAAEAIGDKPGKVTVSGKAVQISAEEARKLAPISEMQPGEYVCLEVRDTGCGMDEATVSQIFDPFFTTKFTGRGLGLAAVQGIVRGHKGALRVESVIGVGSVFSVFLPTIKNLVDTPALEPDTKPSLQGSGTILVIDDEEVVRDAAVNALHHFGYRVIVATDGLEGILEYELRGPEIVLVLLDMTMPLMGGEETLKRIREKSSTVPVLLMSGYSESEAVNRFRESSFSGFLQKPFSAYALGEKVREAVGVTPPR